MEISKIFFLGDVRDADARDQFDNLCRKIVRGYMGKLEGRFDKRGRRRTQTDGCGLSYINRN